MKNIQFPDPFCGQDPNNLKILTLIELRMRSLAGQILEKPNWWNKVRDTEIVGKWRKEFVEQDIQLVRKTWFHLQPTDSEDDSEEHYGQWSQNKRWPHKVITRKQLDYIFDWLKWLADQRDPVTGIEMMHISNVYQSYNLISPELREALLRGASVLESVPEAEKDWHPGSNNQVLDLIHPSLNCLRIGKSLVRNPATGSLYVPSVDEYIDAREDLGHTPFSSTPYSLSRQFQWLPTDFSVSETGEVQHLSYINNLHPDDHKALYLTITTVLERFVPLWERVLADVASPQRPVIEADPFEWYQRSLMSEPSEPVLEVIQKDYPGDTDAARREYYRAYHIWKKLKEPCIPEPDPFTPPDPKEQVSLTLKGRKIQVIVKMANITLTPEVPEYAGGSWHVEGMDNEKIVAIGIYYYDSSNVTESKISFRTALCEDMDQRYQKGDHKGYLMVYGIDGSDGPLNQNLGSVITKEGKCLAFPNIWQHRVSPFKLVDTSKPGHRKILCFFLVNPTIEILSTSVVPPQQFDWCMRELERAPAMQNLPVELFEMITDWLKADDAGRGGVITMEHAKEEREKLMKERAKVVFKQNEQVYELPFSMREH
ncbi:hypothetical protein OE88DRAFT_1626555 [Heliocybe sulcata]|uniref:Uncharacterized protein n=1 Tax=Heliocybe sulcata TaxID=5364 RepID=A0A5C3N9Z7_9AGAM|nr:hypothetical protein OE88DRAFT_1626555 [Heliocybe sulcata]